MAVKKTTFTLRLEEHLRDSFVAAAQSNDRPAAQLIRDFMRSYVEKNNQGSLFQEKKGK